MVNSVISVSVRALSKDASIEDIEAATAVMGSAFKNGKPYAFHSFTEYLVGGHIYLVPDIHRAQIKAGLVGGRVYVAESPSTGIIGAAVWFGPGEELLGSAGQAEAGFNQFMADLGSKDADIPAWWMKYFLPTYGKFTAEALGNPEYKLTGWHLQLLGVNSEYQRHGVGTVLVQFVENQARESTDPGSKHLSVETETEGARAFYKAVGFIEKGETVIGSEKKLNGTLPMWCFSKELA